MITEHERKQRRQRRAGIVGAVVAALLIGGPGLNAALEHRSGQPLSLGLPSPQALRDLATGAPSPEGHPAPGASLPGSDASIAPGSSAPTLQTHQAPAAARPGSPAGPRQPGSSQPSSQQPGAPAANPPGSGGGDPGTGSNAPTYTQPAPETHSYPPVPEITYTAVATVSSVSVYDAPNGSLIHRESNPEPLGSTRVFLAKQTQGSWVEVYLPERPNGSLGWVRSNQVNLQANPWHIDISRNYHELVVYNHGRVVHVYTVAVGKPSSPTPGGFYYVNAMNRLSNPNGAYGPAAEGLSGHSETYQTFGSGDATVGIHGSDEPGSIGHSASHGCVRMYNGDALALYNTITLGTPVHIY